MLTVGGVNRRAVRDGVDKRQSGGSLGRRPGQSVADPGQGDYESRVNARDLWAYLLAWFNGHKGL